MPSMSPGNEPPSSSNKATGLGSPQVDASSSPVAALNAMMWTRTFEPDFASAPSPSTRSSLTNAATFSAPSMVISGASAGSMGGTMATTSMTNEIAESGGMSSPEPAEP